MVIVDETVLLVEQDPRSRKLRVRPVVVRRGMHTIMTTMQDAGHNVTQLFRCVDDEKDLTGRCRVFREVVEAVAPPPPERPLYDELHVIFTDEVSKPTIF